MLTTTHSQLIKKAERWCYSNTLYRNKYKCNIVFRELVSWCRETPDLLAWARGHVTSLLIEVKVSRGDFLADKKKFYRRTPEEQGMGNFRFYCSPYNLIKAEELPTNWGLLYLSKTGKRILLIKPAEYQKANLKEEYKFLLSVVKRFKATAAINGSDFRDYLNYKDRRKDENY